VDTGTSSFQLLLSPFQLIIAGIQIARLC